MDEIKRITKNELYEIASTKKFSKNLLAKDYVLTEILFLLKNVPNIYFKGGTALQKTILHHSRLSEDIDFTLTTNVKKIDLEIIQILEKSKMFNSITHDKNVTQFIRIVVAYNLFEEIKGTVFIDLNEKADLLCTPEKKVIEHFYKNNIPNFSINLLAEEELIAEKLRAGITRNKPRDHFDIYQIIKTHHQINYKLAEEKCKNAGVEFSIIRLFNKAKTLKNRWGTDMVPLLAEEIEFTTVMCFLAKHFKLKEEKQKKSKKFIYSEKNKKLYK
jgi:predicted nucleotidyltransferase component of viral defense system